MKLLQVFKLKKGTLLAIGLVVFILMVFGIGPLFVFAKYGPANSPGVFGDTFGAVNALFSGGTCIGLVWTIYLQIQEREAEEKARADMVALVRQQAEAMITQARLSALTARIEVYGYQIKTAYDQGRVADAHRMRDQEQFSQVKDLDELLRETTDRHKKIKEQPLAG